MNVGWQRAINGLRGAGIRVLVVASLAAPAAGRAADTLAMTSFKTSGTAFTVDGKSFFVTGLKNRYLTFGSKDEVIRVLDDAVAIRNDGNPIWHVLQDAAARRRTDSQSSNSSKTVRETP